MFLLNENKSNVNQNLGVKNKTHSGHIKKERPFSSKIRQRELYFCFTETELYKKNYTSNERI